MMKFYILALVFAAAHAKNFTVTDKNETCLILQLEGKVALTANKTVSLNFDDATEIESSNCTLIKLNLTQSVEVWFQFDDVSGLWEVTPKAQFVPEVVFGKEFNSSDPVVYTAKNLEKDFKKSESYQCLATTLLSFNPSPSSKELNITVEASTTNFKIQSLNSSKFVTGEKCQADTPTTQVPTTPAHTSPVPTKPSSLKQNFSCEANNVTQFRVIGIFSLSITYNKTDGKRNTVKIDVPPAQIANETDCSSKFNETLVFTFFDGWRIEYIFKVDDLKSEAAQKYYVSNVTVTYFYDSNLPNSSTNGSATAHHNQEKYLEASTSGYYTCNDVSLALDPDVTLHTKDFKYKAFNDKGDIKFTTGHVTECTGDEKSNSVVPIAVGAALAGLVVIVLIAYLIGRRRSRKAGYESV